MSKVQRFLTAFTVAFISLVLSFTSVLAAGQPTVTNSAATLVHNNWMTLNGEVTVINDTSITDRGFVWDTSTHGDPGNVAPAASGYANNWTEAGAFGLGTFNHVITGLVSGSNYKWRACALNDAGFWGYSAELNQTTTNTDRFWVPSGGTGTGNWDASTTTHWSLNSGGASGASVPGTSTDTYFDANSFTGAAQVVTITATANCRDLDWSAVTNNPLLTGTFALNIYGSFTAGTMGHSYTGTRTFAATTGPKTINQTGLTWDSTTIFNGAGGSWQLTGAFDDGAAALTLTNGTLDTNGQTVTCGAFTTPSGTQTLTLGATNWSGTSFDISGANTFNCNTSTITLSSSLTSATAGSTYNNVIITKSATISGTANTFANLTVNNSTGDRYSVITLGGDQTVTSTFTATGDAAGDRLMVMSNIDGDDRSISAAVVSSTFTDYKDISGLGAGSWDISAGANNSIGFPGCSGITFTYPWNPTDDVYWYGNSANWDSGTSASYYQSYNWSLVSGGANCPRHAPPTATNNAIFDANSFTLLGETVTIRRSSTTCKNWDCTGVLYAPTFSWGGTLSDDRGITVSGSLIMPDPVTINLGGATAYNSFSFSSSGANTINMAGVTVSAWVVNTNFGGSGSYTFLTNTPIIPNSFSFGAGTTVNFGTYTINTSGLSFNATTTVTAGTYTLNCSGNFTGGGHTFYDVNLLGAGSWSVTGANTFHNLTRIGTAILTDGVRFGADQVVTNTFTLTGYNAIYRLGFGSTVVGTQHQVTVNGSNVITYTNVSDSAASGSASKDISAGQNSDYGDNLGWIFTVGVFNYWVGNSGNWSDILHWASTSGGASGSGRIPLIQDIAVFDVNSFSIPGRTVTIDVNDVGGIDTSTVTNSPTITKAGTVNSYMGFDLGSSTYTVTDTYMMGSNTITMSASGVYTFTGNLRVQTNPAYSTPVNFNTTFHVGGTIYLVSGVLCLQGFGVTADAFDSATTTYARAINLNSSIFTLEGTGAITKWNVAATNLNVYNTASTIVFTNSSTNTQTFAGAGITTYGGLVIGGAGNYICVITGSNTFTTFTVDRSLAAKTVQFTGGTTTTANNFYFPTSGTTVTTLTSTSGSTAATLSQTTGTVSSDYLDIRILPTTGGASFYAGTHSTVKAGTITNLGGVLTGSPLNLYEGSTNTPTVTTVGTFTVLIPAPETGTATSGPAVLVTGSPKALVSGTQTITTTGVAPGTINIVVAGSGWLLTSPLAPTVLTIAASNITNTGARFNGDVTGMGGYGAFYAYFHYGTDPLLATYSSTAPMSSIAGIGSYSYDATGLATETLYYFQAVTNDGVADLSYGSILSFTTSGRPVVVTLTAIQVSATQATIQGQIISMGNYTTVDCFFEYGITASYGGTTPFSTLTSEGAFSYTLTNLNPATTYHFRAAVTYNGGLTLYGLDANFYTNNTVVMNNPDSGPFILTCFAYQNTYVTGDIMILVEYNIPYSTLPAIPVSETYIIRYLDATGVPKQSIVPYPYQKLGYWYGAAAMYWAPGAGPTWGEEGTVELMGNPTVTWAGTAPVVSETMLAANWVASTLVTVGRAQICNTILAPIATDLQYDWNLPLLAIASTGTVLNANYGQQYFSNVIPYFTDVCSSILTTTQSQPINPPPPATNSTTYQQSLMNTWINSIIGPDIIAVSGALGIGTDLWLFLVFLLISVLFLAYASYKLELPQAIPLLFIPVFVGGIRIGVVSMSIGVAACSILFIISMYLLIHRRAAV